MFYNIMFAFDGCGLLVCGVVLLLATRLRPRPRWSWTAIETAFPTLIGFMVASCITAMCTLTDHVLMGHG